MSLGIDLVEEQLFHVLFPLIKVSAVLNYAVGYGFNRFCFQHVLQLFLEGLYSLCDCAFLLASLSVDLIP